MIQKFVTENSHISILGAGKTVQAFLTEAQKLFPNLKIAVYTRKSMLSTEFQASNISIRPVEEAISDNSPTFYCCSENEEEILRQTTLRDRMVVAQANTNLTVQFIQQGFFNNRSVFVLTNPSELISEIIYQHTQNHRIYALGISVDHSRYQALFAKLGIKNLLTTPFELAGFHYDVPIPIINEELETIVTEKLKVEPQHLFEALHLQFKKKVASEFIGLRPPFLSGAKALQDAVIQLIREQPLEVSGYSATHKCFLAGKLHPTERIFKVTEPLTALSQVHFNNSIQRHQRSLKELKASIYQE